MSNPSYWPITPGPRSYGTVKIQLSQDARLEELLHKGWLGVSQWCGMPVLRHANGRARCIMVTGTGQVVLSQPPSCKRYS